MVVTLSPTTPTDEKEAPTFLPLLTVLHRRVVSLWISGRILTTTTKINKTKRRKMSKRRVEWRKVEH